MTQPRPLWTDTALRLEAGTELGPVPVVTATPNDAPRGTVLLVHGRAVNTILYTLKG